MANTGIAPALVTFMPMAGLQEYGPLGGKTGIRNYYEITDAILAKRLRKVIEILRPGGYILLERPFQGVGLVDFVQGIPQNKWEISLLIKKFVRKFKCKVEIHSDISGPYFLIRKNQ